MYAELKPLSFYFARKNKTDSVETDDGNNGTIRNEEIRTRACVANSEKIRERD